MRFASIRIITSDVKRLVRFYEHVTGVKSVQYTPDFSELLLPDCKIAIGSTNTLAMFGGDSIAEAATNRSVIIEFRVNDVDVSYNNIITSSAEIVQTPTTMPWGNRSLLFRDPDGNLVNFFAPVTDDARRRAGE